MDDFDDDYCLPFIPHTPPMSPDEIAMQALLNARSAKADRERREKELGQTPGQAKRTADYLRKMAEAQTGD